MQLSDEIKAQLIEDIQKGDEAALMGMMETLKICLGAESNPNIIQVELTLSQLEYLEGWSDKLNGTDAPSLVRLMVDTMMRINPL
jgi:hypothetical protein